MKVKEICLNCNKEFWGYPSNKKYWAFKFCSHKCQYEYKSKTKSVKRICKVCGKEFKVALNVIKSGRGIYCSKKCSSKVKMDRICFDCSNCGKATFKKKSEYKENRPNFCSKECVNTYFRGENHWCYNNRKTIRTCIVCGNLFETRKDFVEKGNGKYCSSKCMSLHNRGENHCNWKGGVSYEPYCIKFNKEFKTRVRSFFNFQCVECLEPQIEKKLSVHHVNSRKDACCNDDVIPLFVTLCSSCHMKVTISKTPEYWEEHFKNMIYNYYIGKCYFTKEEYSKLFF